MNETNPMEAQLRSWTLRRPSGKIERQLFPEASRARRCKWPELISVGAPVLACGLLTWATLQPPSVRLLPAEGPQTVMLALSLSNQHFAPYFMGNGQSPANRLDTFEWTNGGYSQSSMRSLKPAKAIDLQ